MLLASRSKPDVIAAAEDDRTGFFYGWVIVLALGVTITVSYGTLYYSMGVFLTPVKEDTGWSSGVISGAFAASLLVSGLIGIPVGHLTDRYGARPVMAIGSLLGAAGLMLFSVAGDWWLLYIAWGCVIAASAAATFYLPAFAALANWFDARRGRALGVLTFLGGFASIIFIPLTAQLIEEFGWRTAARLLALIIFAVALPLHAFVLRRRPEPIDARPHGGGVTAGREIIVETGGPGVSPDAPGTARRSIFWLITAAFFLASLATSTVFVHQFSHLVDSGFDATDVALAAGLIGVASLPGRFLLSALSERVDAGIITSAVMILLGASLLALILAANLAMVYAYVLLFGLGFGAITPLRAAMMLDHFGPVNYGKILGMQGAVLALAAAAGPFFAGALRDATGGYDAAFSIMVALYLVAAVLAAMTAFAAPRPAPLLQAA